MPELDYTAVHVHANEVTAQVQMIYHRVLQFTPAKVGVMSHDM